MQLKRDTLLERGKYRILATLGQGGFGITYLAEQALAGRKVCIKEYFPKDYYNRDADTNRVYIGSKADVDTLNRYKEKFIKEASVLARLKHPHIVSVYDVFEENDTAYYVMEHIEGESLGDVVKRRGALDEATAVGYIRQIADALGYIHEQNINHLDVKPGNVMVSSEDDSAILIDFGLAKHYDTSGGQTSSTPVGISHGYAPFEQYKAGGVSSFSPATDIYSLGATLYYLVTSKVPPSATDIGKDGIKTPDNLSPGVQRAIKEAMNYWREERPQSVDDFLKLLDDEPEVVAPVAENTIIDVEPKSADESTVINVEPKQTPQPKNEPKPKRPKRGLWIMLSAFVVAAVASFILLGGGSSAPKQQLPPNNEIWYTSSDGSIVKPSKEGEDIFGAEIESNTYKDGKGIIKFKGDVTTIGGYAFDGCNNLTSVTIPNSVTTIGESAFDNCYWLKSVTIPNSVTTIGERAFAFCKSLKSVTIPNSVTTIGERAFAYCDSLNSVTIPDSVTTIGEWAFRYCSNLTSVTIPNSVKTIEEGAFAFCESLKSVTIPNSVTTIGRCAFEGCSNLKEFKGKFAADKCRCLIIDGVLNSFAIGCGATDYTIPNSVTTIGEWAFGHCESLTSVTIPNKVKTIGESAFYECNSLTRITIPNSVTTIGEWAFGHCESLTSVTIPNKVKTIGKAAFYSCKSLESVTIPDSVKTIGKAAFFGCSLSEDTKDKIESINPEAL